MKQICYFYDYRLKQLKSRKKLAIQLKKFELDMQKNQTKKKNLASLTFNVFTLVLYFKYNF